MAGWSDYADFSSVDTLRLTSLCDGFTPLLKAINERCQASGMSLVPDEIQKLNTTYWNAGGAYYYKYIPTVIEQKITQLIPLFVNHTDNSGDWTGEQSIPNWDESSLLSAIGDTERIPAPTLLDELSVDWLYQQYKIINKLILYIEAPSSKNRRAQQGIGYNLWPTATEAMAEAAANVVETSRTYYAASNEARFVLNSKWRFIAANNYQDLYPGSVLSRAPDICAESSIYAYIALVTFGRFWPFDLDINEDQFSMVDHIENSAISDISFTNFLKPDFSVYPSDITEDDIVSGGLSVGFHYNEVVIIYNFAVPGGFKFVTPST